MTTTQNCCFSFLVLSMNIVSATMAKADVTTECPDHFSAGAVIVIKCLINTTAVSSANCLVDPSIVWFSFHSKIGIRNPLCTTPYPGRCTDNTNGNSCCVSSSGDINTYLCSFVANESVHTMGSITCRTDCLSVPPLTTHSTQGCQAIEFLRGSENTIHGSTTGVTGSASSVHGVVTAVTPGMVITIFLTLLFY